MWALPILLGAATVAQGVLNRELSGRIGLGATAAINGVTVAVFTLLLWASVRAKPDLFPPLLRDAGGGVAWWWWAPGLFGVAIVALIPLAIDRLGPTTVFMAMVAGQLGTGLLIDAWQGTDPIAWQRWLGAALTMAGVLVASWR